LGRERCRLRPNPAGPPGPGVHAPCRALLAPAAHAGALDAHRSTSTLRQYVGTADPVGKEPDIPRAAALPVLHVMPPTGSDAVPDPIACPVCMSPRIVPVIYGYPTAETDQRASRGEVILGGDIVGWGELEHTWQCRTCDRSWAMLDDDDDDEDDDEDEEDDGGRERNEEHS